MAQSATSPAMPSLTKLDPSAAALRGPARTVGQRVSCSIYDRRPQECRSHRRQQRVRRRAGRPGSCGGLVQHLGKRMPISPSTPSSPRAMTRRRRDPPVRRAGDPPAAPNPAAAPRPRGRAEGDAAELTRSAAPVARAGSCSLGAQVRARTLGDSAGSGPEASVLSSE